MDEVLNNFASPAWWVTALLAGIAASLFAAYIKPQLDKIGSRLSASYRQNTEKKRINRKKKISDLRNNLNEQILASIKVNHFRLRSISFFLMGLGMLILLNVASGMAFPKKFLIMLGVAWLLLSLAAFNDILSALSLKGIIEEARESESEDA